MKFYLRNYQHKGAPYRRALREAGHKHTRTDPDVVLFDRDWFMHSDGQARPEILKFLDTASVMIYPHSALPPWWYDGLVKIQPYVKCVFVIGEGQKRVMQVIAPEVRVETTGWPWSGVQEFRSGKVERILFAPIHPAGGRLRLEGLEANRSIVAELLNYKRQRPSVEIIVRYMGNRFQQGLRNRPEFTMIEGVADASTKEIDAADIVIAEGTFMYLSVARGRPTIGINQHVPVRANKMSDRYTPHNWDKYGKDLAYPINFGDAALTTLIDRAQTEQTKWRADFVGDKMDPRAFAAKVEQVWKDAKRRGAVVAQPVEIQEVPSGIF